ncbi:hypothetical protein HYU19_02285 [Candidatus Woesearchaeota archaeon]|nr:hypothetical protein [Candidatus Woesearchaeota archaeon]
MGTTFKKKERVKNGMPFPRTAIRSSLSLLGFLFILAIFLPATIAQEGKTTPE